MSSSKTTHLVIIPTYNEKENIYDFINELCNFDISILIVDDNSPDGTGEIVKKLSTISDQVNLLSRKSKQGLGSAYRDGFCLLYTSPSPRDAHKSRIPSSA